MDRLRATASPVRELRIVRPDALIAFSQRDRHRAGYAEATALARAEGFAAVLRPVGGTFAPMHPGSLVVEEFGSEDDLDLGTRFGRHVAALVDVFESFDIDAHVGEVPGEYCPGAYSVNRSGLTKLSGTAQRVARGAWLVSSVVQVHFAAPLRRVTRRVAAALDASIDVRTLGSIQDSVPDIDVDDVARRLRERFGVP